MVCKKLKWKWTGHIIREKNEKWTKIMSDWYPRDGKGTKGRQIKLWEDVFKIAVGPEWLRIAGDREFVERQRPKYLA